MPSPFFAENASLIHASASLLQVLRVKAAPRLDVAEQEKEKEVEKAT